MKFKLKPNKPDLKTNGPSIATKDPSPPDGYLVS